MSIELSERIARVKPSATIQINLRAAQLRAAGHEIINLSVGEPDFDTPDFIKQAGIRAIEEGCTKYTQVDGTPALKDAIIHKLQRDNHLTYTREEIIVSCGVKQGLYNLLQAILNDDDEVIIPAPYWVSYPEMVALANAKTVVITADMQQQFKILPEQLEAAITPKTRLLFLNSPNCPSGAVYTADELRKLANVLVKHPHVTIASDDIYEYILWGMPHFVNILNVAPELKEQTIIFNGVSKSYAMTGWRIGYAAGPAHVINAMKTIQSQSTTNPNSMAQQASVVALNADPKQLQPMFDAYKERHDLVYQALISMPGVRCIPAEGSFYIFPDVSEVIKNLRLQSDIELTEQLMQHAHVAVVPGSPFGSPGHLRISCVLDKALLTQAMDNIAALFSGKLLGVTR